VQDARTRGPLLRADARDLSIGLSAEALAKAEAMAQMD